jgi:D-alanine-D-alanine ligase
MDNVKEKFGRIGVLMGGVSAEREISLKSGKAVSEALLQEGYDVVPMDIVEGDEDKILSVLLDADIDVAFIALHGKMGEDGTIQAVLEKAGIIYTGSGVEASRLAFNKVSAQDVFKKNGIHIAPHVALSQSKGFPSGIDAIIGKLGSFPVVVKPACQGSSIGVSVAETNDELEASLRHAWQFDDTALLEKFIKGRELTVGILGEEALPVVEIRPRNGFFDFEAKYTKGMTEYIVPAAVSRETAGRLRQQALKAHRALGCRHFSRVDFMLDADQAAYVLEVNTIPGFTATSLLPKAAGQHGVGFNQLCVNILELAYGKKKEIDRTTLRHP